MIPHLIDIHRLIPIAWGVITIYAIFLVLYAFSTLERKGK